MQIDFVKVPYTTGPNMIRNTGPVFISPSNREIIKKKKQEIEIYKNDLYGQIEGSNKIVESAARYCNVYTDDILDFALMIEEDVAVMHQGKLAAICFCFPSGFKPSEKLGMHLSDIHRPVADGELLIKSSPGIAKAMCEHPSFRRWVWTVTVNPDLSNHPSNQKNTVPQNIDDLYFRVETQTTASIDKETSLFFVKVDVVPLKTVWNQRILDSINSMSDEVLTYKNLYQIKKLLNTLNLNPNT
jgi:hypothetical protein